MVFSSVIFLFIFLPIFLIGYNLIEKKYKNLFTLISSLVFYAWGAYDFILIALASIIVDYFIVLYMDKQSGKKRFIYLWGSILLNLSILLYFKYFNFFTDNLSFVLDSIGMSQLKWPYVVLPIGISFYTFQKISYSVDVYRKSNPPLKNIVDYSLYILLFPQLIAGPIVRYGDIASQLFKRNHYNYQYRVDGIYRFCIGLAKKVLIANVLGQQADIIFSMGDDISNLEAWFGILCYTFQIYFDFSGYSDMAIGLGMLIGFRFPENFNSPYISKSITEFWRRWHITLSSWMRDYLYIPLGGNRVKSKARLYINLSITFLISGLWHGAAWNFIIWGAFHGFFLIADRIFLNRLTASLNSFYRIVLTFFITINGWVLFRAEGLNDALSFYENMYSLNFNWSILDYLDNNKLIFTLFIAVIISFGSQIKKLNFKYISFLEGNSNKNSIVKFFISLTLLTLSTADIVSSDFNPFIYFRF